MHKIVKILLVVISAIAFVFIFFMPDGDAPFSEAIDSGAISGMFIIAYILLGVAVAASVFFGLINVAATKGGLKKVAFGVVGLLVLMLIAYGLASGTDVSIEKMAKLNIETSEGSIKAVGAGINMFAIMLLLAVGLIGFGGVKNAISK